MQKHLAAGSFLTALLLFPAFCSAQTVSIVSGNGQLVCVNCPLSGTQFAPLVVQVNDATGNPVANTTVTWTDTQPDGQLTVATSTTGTTGQATYALGPQGVYIGPSFFPFTVLASALGAGVQFVETSALASGVLAPISVTLVSAVVPPALSGAVGTTAATPLVVSVAGTNGIFGGGPVLSGIQVRLQSGTGGPTVSCATQAGQPAGTVLTDTTGTAKCYPVFGGQVGTGTYTIVAGGNFQSLPSAALTVTGGPPAIIKYISGNNQRVNAGVKTPFALTAEVTDTSGNPSNAAAVTWSVIAGTATLTSPVTSSASTGLVSAFVTPTVGPVSVKVALTGNTSVQYTFTVNVNIVVTALQAVSGSGQEATEGSPFTAPLLVQVNDNALLVQGATVNYAVTSGSATLSAPTAGTDAEGQAQVTATAGATPGPVVITASIVSGTTTYTQTFDLTVLPPLGVTAVVNAAGFDQSPSAASPCSLVTIYGTGLATGLQGLVLPFIAPQYQVAGVSVQFGGVPAPILYVANFNGVQSLSAQVPCEVPSSAAVPPATVPMVVTVDNVALPAFAVPVTPYSPGIFQFADSDGQTRAVLVREDGSFITVNNPAQPGDTLRMFVTGLGQTTPPLFTDEFDPLSDQSGTWVPQSLPVNAGVIVGVDNGGALVLSAKYAYGMVGVYEVDFQVPNNAAPGNNAPFAIVVQQGNTVVFGNGSLLPIK
ncbi:MAG: hypothetical protein ABSG56_10965 [Bryobacteraceae bacterium]|jgi:uncharacterized protein (TIGR03437 family)